MITNKELESMSLDELNKLIEDANEVSNIKNINRGKEIYEANKDLLQTVQIRIPMVQVLSIEPRYEPWNEDIVSAEVSTSSWEMGDADKFEESTKKEVREKALKVFSSLSKEDANALDHYMMTVRLENMFPDNLTERLDTKANQDDAIDDVYE